MNPDLEKAIETVREGGVIAYPTEAVYGLGCDPRNETAVQRILALKQRDVRQGLILVAADFTQFGDLIKSLPDELTTHVFATWPGPVTWLWPAADNCPAWLTGGRDTLAIRVSAHPLVQRLCRSTGPLVSTSANPHGQPPARSAKEAKAYFPEGVDYVLGGETGGAEAPSEIRDVRTGEILRSG